MAFIGLSIPSRTIASLLNSHSDLIGLTFKPANIIVGNAVTLEVNKVIFDSSVNIDPVSFIGVDSIEGTIYREDNNGGAPYLKPTGGNAIINDRFQYISLTSNNFAFFTKDALFTLGKISANLIFSGAAIKPGLMAYPNSGITGEYGSLKVEVDRGDLKIISGNKDNMIPAAIVGTPCPPHWDPFQ